MDRYIKDEICIAICDDEPLILEKLERKCREILEPYYELSVSSAESANELLAIHKPFQIALLDVQLKEDDGIELARRILASNPSCRIIFISGFLYAVSEVYQVPHFCFVLKDQIDQHLPRFLKRAADAAADDAGKNLIVCNGKHTEQIQLAQVMLMERRGHTTYLKLKDGREVQTTEKLTDLNERINQKSFVRCHISYIVNLKYVKRMEENGFKMENDQWVPISRPNQQMCKDAFWANMGNQF